MTLRTLNIILACKGIIHPEIEDRYNRVVTYISEECMLPMDLYTDEEGSYTCELYVIIDKAITNAMFDYIDTCDKPSSFLRQVIDCDCCDEVTLEEKICDVFSLVEIKNTDGEFINGFTEELFKKQRWK